MSRFRKTDSHTVPLLTTTALPDLIFTLLFFFILVTNMRSVPVLTQYQLPTAAELQKLKDKSALIHIIAGNNNGKPEIQLNSALCTMQELPDLLQSLQSGVAVEDRTRITVILKIDRHTDMGTVNDIRQILRKCGLLTVYYAGSHQ
jgi:biopolymer transport protein ExbD